MVLTDKSILRELSFLEQFLAGVKRLGDGVTNLSPPHLCVKYKHLYSECRFAINVLKWRIEDDISKLGIKDDDLVKAPLLDDAAWDQLEEIAIALDAVIVGAEKESNSLQNIRGWSLSYDRENSKLGFKLLHEEN